MISIHIKVDTWQIMNQGMETGMEQALRKA